MYLKRGTTCGVLAVSAFGSGRLRVWGRCDAGIRDTDGEVGPVEECCRDVTCEGVVPEIESEECCEVAQFWGDAAREVRG